MRYKKIGRLLSWFVQTRLGRILFYIQDDKLIKITVAYLHFIYPFINRRFWNKLGGEHYYNKTTKSSRHLLASALLVNILKKWEFENLLEVGCGAGNILGYMHQFLPDVSMVGCDFSDTQIETAGVINGVQFDVADARNLPYQDKSFDVVITVGCLVHIPKKHIKQAVNEIQRVVRHLIIVLEEDYEYANEELMQISIDTGWHFYHNYEELFDKFKMEVKVNNMKKEVIGLHTHLFIERNNEI